MDGWFGAHHLRMGSGARLFEQLSPVVRSVPPFPCRLDPPLSLGALSFRRQNRPRAYLPKRAAHPNLRSSERRVQCLPALRGTVSVCAVAGVYRTGKSYVLNQLAGRDGAFGTGSTVQACTKGIWMCA
eukprot:6153315-Prymnesium_polylepis.1